MKQVRRVIEANGSQLSYRLDMAAAGQPLVFHLEATLETMRSPG